MRLHTTEATQYEEMMGAAKATCCGVGKGVDIEELADGLEYRAGVLWALRCLGMSFCFFTPRTYTALTIPTTRKVSSYATFAESSLSISSTRLSAKVPSASSRQ